MRKKTSVGLFLFAFLALGAVSCVNPVDSVIPPSEDDPEHPPHTDPEDEAFHLPVPVTFLG